MSRTGPPPRGTAVAGHPRGGVGTLVRLRVRGFVRTGRALAPLLTALVALGVLYGGGQAPAGEAYGVSAVVLFPILAWQSALLLDVEPDTQRRLARLALGRPHREWVAGLAAAALTGLGLVALALAVPWPLAGIRGPQAPGEPSLALGAALGVWAHLLALPPAVALGALASRAVTRRVAVGLTVLVAGGVATLVLGLRDSALPWLGPPVMAVARAAAGRPEAGTVAALTLHALLWTLAATAGYAALRRSRS
ncbi:MAG TPA: hypothetical protein VNV66_11660 [Pilimelia sp.]|nr:hypothetical protein [Pilimelia sp.]